jgi:hypothetical protein
VAVAAIVGYMVVAALGTLWVANRLVGRGTSSASTFEDVGGEESLRALVMALRGELAAVRKVSAKREAELLRTLGDRDERLLELESRVGRVEREGVVVTINAA